jgi:hypothetical protein
MKPIWPYLFVGVVILIASRVAIKNYPGGDDKSLYWLAFAIGIMATGVLSGLAYGAGYLLAEFIGRHSEQSWQLRWKATIVSMRSSEGIKGQLSGGAFIVHGYIRSSPVYYYYTKERDSKYKPRIWFIDSETSIHEEDRADGEVRQFDARFNREWLSWVANPSDRLLMEFHIPAGSLKQKIAIE